MDYPELIKAHCVPIIHINAENLYIIYDMHCRFSALVVNIRTQSLYHIINLNIVIALKWKTELYLLM